MMPRRTPCPIAVLPFKQYAVAVKDPLLIAPADAAAETTFFSETVFLTNFLSSATTSGLSILFSFNCESFAELRTDSVLACA